MGAFKLSLGVFENCAIFNLAQDLDATDVTTTAAKGSNCGGYASGNECPTLLTRSKTNFFIRFSQLLHRFRPPLVKACEITAFNKRRGSKKAAPMLNEALRLCSVCARNYVKYLSRGETRRRCCPDSLFGTLYFVVSFLLLSSVLTCPGMTMGATLGATSSSSSSSSSSSHSSLSSPPTPPLDITTQHPSQKVNF
ncbi:hypothetical protein ElyMa_002069000 [Elysia marginata]|uniref:Uncharacterized protein n=1 Tax=Elysia marginata TaxID=1093978 RepID=A0AAV4FAL5_9GAST|nr:hypothetical protein ElyMa_002069000 [Elysia marginata]